MTKPSAEWSAPRDKSVTARRVNAQEVKNAMAAYQRTLYPGWLTVALNAMAEVVELQSDGTAKLRWWF